MRRHTMTIRTRLIATVGPLTGRTFVFDSPTVCTIGRASDCGLPLPNDPGDLTASRRHCELDIDEQDVWVRDLGSRNGTFVNRELIGQRPREVEVEEWRGVNRPGRGLHDGDSIRVGNNVFEVAIRDADADLACPPEHISSEPEFAACI
jgi:pSer/pThr/pTyr-binding forkhead associated (FHA) protein